MGTRRRLLTGTVMLLGSASALSAQEQAGDTLLSANQQGIVLIASHTATGNVEGMTQAFNRGLDAGLAINEVKEVLLQLSAYCGFPRSLRAINTFMAVLEDRETRGIRDEIGPVASPVGSADRYEVGKEVLGALTGEPQNRPRSGYAAFFPAIERFLKEHLFADVFGRGVLSYQDREIATVAALVSMGGVEPFARSHLRLAMNVGVTESQLEQLLALLGSAAGDARAGAGRDLLSQVLASQVDSESGRAAGVAGSGRAERSLPAPSGQAEYPVFPRGQRLTGERFTGAVWVEMLVTDEEVFGARVGNVTFEPGARTNWHSHPGGQILLATNGAGYHQVQGGTIQLLRPGDVVEVGPDVVHWHGATPSGEFTHVAVVTNSLSGSTVWLRPVTDQEYNRFW